MWKWKEGMNIYFTSWDTTRLSLLFISSKLHFALYNISSSYFTSPQPTQEEWLMGPLAGGRFSGFLVLEHHQRSFFKANSKLFEAILSRFFGGRWSQNFWWWFLGGDWFSTSICVKIRLFIGWKRSVQWYRKFEIHQLRFQHWKGWDKFWGKMSWLLDY